MMKKIQLTQGLEISQLVHGHWRLLDWKMTENELLTFAQELIDLGFNTFDHADIYGDYQCERAFGKALAQNKSLRKDIKIITKCGIRLMSNHFPERQIKYYDYSFEAIVSSVEKSLQNLGTEYIDLLLLHRPSPFFAPEEVAMAFQQLKKQGKVLYFGVSNYTPLQFEMLQSYLDVPLVSNQVEISPYCLEHFENGNMDFFLKQRVKPMAWSPLAGGRLFRPEEEKGHRILKVLRQISEELEEEQLDKIVYSWLLKHPAQIIPIIGSGNLSRIKNAVDACNIKMSLEQWFRIYTASTGVEVP